MATNFSLRQLSPEDGAAYAALLAASPDTGSVGTAVHFEIDPYQALLGLHNDTVGVVAETPGFAGLIGSGLIRFRQIQWEDQVLPSALFNTLVVHPDFRRRGAASQLARWREDYARSRFGEEGVIWAIIQRNNTGSERTAQKWASQFLTHRLTIIPMKMRSTPPTPARQLVVRPIQPADFVAVVEQLNQFYRNYNLYSPETRESLVAWLNETPFDYAFRHYQVVTDKASRLLAGLALAETFRLRTTVITHMPAALSLLNLLVHVVPSSGILREVAVSRVWYAPGQNKAARYLFESMRWEWRDRGTSLLLYTDVRSPLVEIYGLRPWTGKTIESIALRGPTPCSAEKLCYYA
jgi:GNAT superfamily N-acetyltransferase